ncbi:MAG: HAD family hydrolase [Candidatus Micrarchaeota archaeon]
MKKHMIKCVIFDLDNTLIDSFEVHLRSYRRILEEFGVRVRKKDFATRYGMRLREIAASMLPQKYHDKIGYVVKKKKKMFERDIKKVKLFPDTRRTLSALRKMGFKLGIASSANSRTVRKIMRLFKMNGYFDFIVGGNDVKNGKPAPDVLFEAARYCARDMRGAREGARGLGACVKECVYVGDTPIDADAARGARMKFIGVSTGIHTKKQLARYGDRVVRKLGDVIKLVEN